MEEVKLETYVSEETARKLGEFAELEGKEPSEVVREAVLNYIGRERFETEILGEDEDDTLTGLMDRAERRVEFGFARKLSEEEAMNLAVEEQHAARRERQSGRH